MNNNCNYSIYWKYVDIFDNTLNRQRHSHKHIFMLYLDYSHSYYLHFLSWHWSVFENYSCMSSLLTFNKISFLTSQKGDCIAGVAYLKVKNHVTCWKTIIPEKSTLPKTFCFQKARLQIYVTKIIRPPDFLCVFTRTSETDFPAKKKYRKPEFREKKENNMSGRDVFVSDRDPQQFFFIILLWFQSMMCYPPSGYIILILKKLKLHGDQGGGRQTSFKTITQTSFNAILSKDSFFKINITKIHPT